MSTSLPERPDLDQLRRQAKELRDAVRQGDPDALERFARHHASAFQGHATLAASQLVIARELGFTSWPQLKATIESRAGSSEDQAQAFVTVSLEGRVTEAAAILEAAPSVARESLAAAVMLGDAQRVGEWLARDPGAAVAIDEIRGWPQLLYACYSPWHRIDPARDVGLAGVVQLLLAAGANADTNDGARQGLRSALKGAVEMINPKVVQVLLEAGANPDLGRPIGEAAGQRDHRCLELLLSHGARVVAGTWTVGAAVFADDAYAVSVLLETMRDSGGQTQREATESLADAAADASLEVVTALLDAGGDPEAYDDDRGMSALRRAVRAGKRETAALLAGRGAADDSTEVDRFIGSCVRADRASAEALVHQYPDLREAMSEGDRKAIVEAAGSASAASIGLMIELGFSAHARNELGEQPLHSAAYSGKAEVVRILIESGAEVDARDERFDSTPLAFATVGSGEQAGRPGNWAEVVRLLVDAGASKEGVWIGDKAPSEEVSDLLRGYGISPDEEREPEPDHEDPPALSLGTGVTADVARHLEVAYRDRDLELLGSLLHPEVQWTGVCRNRHEVLDWYRGLLAEGTEAAVESMEVDGDSVVLGLSVSRRAEGARPAPPEHLYQVFAVEDAQIVDIRGYPDRSSALTRTHS